jgi:PAS domain S-box-containing protein
MTRIDTPPTGQARTFADEEIIVSKTDVHGKITYVNDVFERVSLYSRRELVGAPHSIIRHPDMPRCVFQVMWDTIQAGREIFAYVVNLARNGDHYWVFAHITPTVDAKGAIQGYHSNRRTADGRALQQIEPLYAELRRAEAGHSRKQEAVEAGLATFHTLLQQRGQTYDEFIWSL